jgi:hypothetical protein
MDYQSFNQQEIRDGVHEVINRQASRNGKGFIAVQKLDIVSSLPHGNCLGVRYRAIFTLTNDAVVWTENSAGIDYIANLLHFEPVPTVETFKNKGITQSRVYQFWAEGTEFITEGIFCLVKTAEGWFAPRQSWYDNSTEEEILNASVNRCLPPEKYLLVSLYNDEPVLVYSHTPNPEPSSKNFKRKLIPCEE